MVLIGPLLRTGHVWLFFFSFSSQRLHSEPQSCLRKFQSGDKIVIDSFKGVEFAQWLIRKNESRNLDDALVSCQQLLDAGLIKPRKFRLFNPYNTDGLWEWSVKIVHWPLSTDLCPLTFDHWSLFIDLWSLFIDLRSFAFGIFSVCSQLSSPAVICDAMIVFSREKILGFGESDRVLS